MASVGRSRSTRPAGKRPTAGQPKGSCRVIHADTACDTNAIRQAVEARIALANIPPTSHRRWKSCLSPFFLPRPVTCPGNLGPRIGGELPSGMEGRMRKSRFTDEQMVSILQENDRDMAATVAERHGVSEQTIDTWRKRFRAFEADDVRRLKQLEAENAAEEAGVERDLEIEVMEEVAAKSGERAGPLRGGGVCDGPGPVATAGLHADRGLAFGAELPFAPGGEGCTGARAHGGALGPASALGVSPDGPRRVDEGGSGDRGRRLHPLSRVIEVLSRIACERGAPLYLRSDNGPEFVSRALLAWIVDQGIETALIDPGKPWQDGAGESFNGKFPDVPEPRMVPLAGGQGDDRSLAPALQRGAAPLEPRPSDAGGVRLEDRNRTPSGHDVADRCGMWCLRDPPRRSTASQGAV